MKLRFVATAEIEPGMVIGGVAETRHGNMNPRREVNLWPEALQVDDVHEDRCWRILTFENGTTKKFNSAIELVVIEPNKTWVTDIKAILITDDKLRRLHNK